MTTNYPGGPRPTDVYSSPPAVDLFCPDGGMDAIQSLEREGIRDPFPENQTCCGQPVYTSGYAGRGARGREGAGHRPFPERLAGDRAFGLLKPIGGMIRHHYPKLFAEDADR